MRRLLAIAVLLGPIAACSSFNETGTSDAGPATDPDAAADAGVAADAATPDGAPPRDGGVVEAVPPGGKLVFVSTTMSHPPGPGSTFVGYADLKCKEEAAIAGRSGDYVAWLATAAQTAIGRLPTDKTWYLRTGDKIGDFIILSNGAIPLAIDRNAAGLVPTGTDHTVWTGTTVGGKTSADTCTNWTISIGSGGVGDYTQPGARWATSGNRNCSQDARFYCFER